jgi:hypothetical protein
MYVGDADQKAYAAMELQTMALDSRSQVFFARIVGLFCPYSRSLLLLWNFRPWPSTPAPRSLSRSLTRTHARTRFLSSSRALSL